MKAVVNVACFLLIGSAWSFLTIACHEALTRQPEVKYAMDAEDYFLDHKPKFIDPRLEMSWERLRDLETEQILGRQCRRDTEELSFVGCWNTRI